MAGNIVLNKIKKEIRESDPNLTPAEVEALAIAEYNKRNPDKQIIPEPEDTAEFDDPDDEPKEEPVIAKPVKSEPKFELTKSELDSLLATMKADIIKEMSAKVPAATAVVAEEDDYDPIGAKFFAHSHFRIIFGYKRNGKEVLPPYEPIKLNHAASWTKSQMGTRETRTVQICMVELHSKKEIEFMRNFPQYNQTVFETLNDAKDVDVFLTDYVNLITPEVVKMDQHQLVQRAQNMGIPVSTNVDDMKRQLIYKMAYQKLEADKRKFVGTASAGIELTDKVVEQAMNAK